MSEPFLAEIRVFGFTFAPRGWAQCNGQILPINQNQALFSLLGTTYGGDGRTTFALPDLRGRTPLHVGNSYSLGQRSGQENHTLTANEIPQHTHQAQASSNPPSTPIPNGNALAASVPNEIYAAAANLQPMRAGTLANAGGGQAHDNMQPFLTLNFCIALQGLFPSRN
ncbi:MAG: phage tail protein [Anaerolineales bacterium]|nr:phage tail protein [Anaerolineales bacterium]